VQREDDRQGFSGHAGFCWDLTDIGGDFTSSPLISLHDFRDLSRFGYQNDWQTPISVQAGSQDLNTFLEKGNKINDGQTNMDADPYARDRFLQLAEQVNEYLGDENSSGPANKKLIVTLISEYCELAESWVFYIVEWPLKRLINQHLVLSTINFQSDVYSPPRKA
jgi:hypothetical protein